MFKRLSGAPHIEYRPKTASTAFTNGGLCNMVSGFLLPGDATSGDHHGIILRTVAATDDDYASATQVPIDVALPGDLFEVDVPNGDLATADIGIACDLMADGAGIDPDAVAKGVVTIVGYISASKAIVKVNAMAAHANVATT